MLPPLKRIFSGKGTSYFDSLWTSIEMRPCEQLGFGSIKPDAAVEGNDIFG